MNGKRAREARAFQHEMYQKLGALGVDPKRSDRQVQRDVKKLVLQSAAQKRGRNA